MDRELALLSLCYLFFAIPLAFMDSRKFRISLPFLCVGFVTIILCRFVVLSMPLVPVCKNLVFALLSSGLIYGCTRVLTDGGLGLGDVFFGLFSALYTGFYMNIIATFFAALLGVMYYLLLALVQRHKKKQIVHRPVFAIPFVPFIASASVLTMLLFFVIA
ncbi:MAG: hypothetical protein J6I53_05870 [Treponema sp.]|nr:hypothetical protein [Treponema sp.]